MSQDVPASAALPAGSGHPEPVDAEGEFRLGNFCFSTGETLPELRLHYTTLGSPVRDAEGVVRNAVLILHGTGGNGRVFLGESFGGALFGPGQPLDARRYYIVLPDGIGHGKSSKPSEGLRARFPRYTYDDMVRAQHRLLTEGLGIDHLRLVMGTSMGGMHTWVWGETYPTFMDALMPLASLPVAIAGRNRMIRRMVTDAIRTDPEWRGGEYAQQPRGLVSAIYTLLFMVSVPLQWQRQAPTREAADALFDQLVAEYAAKLDANDMLYHFDASRDYDPEPHLERIEAPLLAVNSADDQVNPPELGILESAIRRVKRGRHLLIPIGEKTRGHRTHLVAELYRDALVALLEQTQPRGA
jgi:homoserine O-acetyltransferase